MLFGKKETIPTRNPYDNEYEELWNVICKTRNRLCGAVKDCLIKIAAIEVYPEGQYKEEAIASTEAAKQVIVSRIIQYEQAITDATTYWKENSDKLEKCKGWNPNGWVCGTKLVEIEISRK